jgi:hypothetical protein
MRIQHGRVLAVKDGARGHPASLGCSGLFGKSAHMLQSHRRTHTGSRSYACHASRHPQTCLCTQHRLGAHRGSTAKSWTRGSRIRRSRFREHRSMPLAGEVSPRPDCCRMPLCCSSHIASVEGNTFAKVKGACISISTRCSIHALEFLNFRDHHMMMSSAVLSCSGASDGKHAHVIHEGGARFT